MSGLKTSHLRELGAEIRSARLQQNLTQAQLAELIGHKKTDYISLLESGRRATTIRMLFRIAYALEMDIMIGFIPYRAS